jgi:hypothetical protein
LTNKQDEELVAHIVVPRLVGAKEKKSCLLQRYQHENRLLSISARF